MDDAFDGAPQSSSFFLINAFATHLTSAAENKMMCRLAYLIDGQMNYGEERDGWHLVNFEDFPQVSAVLF